MDIERLSCAITHDEDYVSFANMGHGESIIITIGGETYLRDFGEWTGNRKNAKDCTVDRILARKESCDFIKAIYHDNCSGYNAILSHPHKDHFSGFRKCFDDLNQIKNRTSTPIFENAYIPRLVSAPKDVLVTKALYECAVNSYLFSNREEFLSLGINFIEFVFVMRALSQNLYHCSYNKPSSTPFRCLLPKDSIASDNYGRLTKTAQSCLADFYRKNDISADDQETIKGLVDSIWEKVLPYLDIEPTRDDNYNLENTKKQLDDIHTQLGELREYIKNNYPDRRFKISDIFNYLKSKLDDASLAFDFGRDDSCCGYWLFLGDNSDDAIISIFGDLKKHYFGIKAAHHGTRTGGCLAKQTHADICVCCTGIGHPKLLPIDHEYIAVSGTCYSLDVPARCTKMCMESRNIHVLCQSLVTFKGCQAVPYFAIICNGC